MRRLRPVLVLMLTAVLMALSPAMAMGPGGWDRVGSGATSGSASLNSRVSALAPGPGTLLVGGPFTDAGGRPNADRAAAWDGQSWSALGSAPLPNGEVRAIAYEDGKTYVGGTFVNAGGNAEADYLAVWDGASWEPFCNSITPPTFTHNVDALQVIDGTLFVGGEFQDGADIPTADYLLACDLSTGESSSLFATDGQFSGPIYALTADSLGTLYAGGSSTTWRRSRVPTTWPRTRTAAGTPWAPPTLRPSPASCAASTPRHQRLRRDRRPQCRGHRAGRSRRPLERLRMERVGRQHRRHERLVPDVGDHLRPRVPGRVRRCRRRVPGCQRPAGRRLRGGIRRIRHGDRLGRTAPETGRSPPRSMRCRSTRGTSTRAATSPRRAATRVPGSSPPIRCSWPTTRSAKMAGSGYAGGDVYDDGRDRSARRRFARGARPRSTSGSRTTA